MYISWPGECWKFETTWHGNRKRQRSTPAENSFSTLKLQTFHVVLSGARCACGFWVVPQFVYIYVCDSVEYQRIFVAVNI